MKPKPQWERIAEPSEGKVHFATTGEVGLATLCGIPDWLGADRKGDGAYTDDAVNCKGCLSIAAYALERGWPAELSKPRHAREARP